jgi:hypothetical protein
MDTLEDLVAQPDVSLALGMLWTRLERQAIEEDRHPCEIMQEKIARNPKAAGMFALLGVWLDAQD